MPSEGSITINGLRFKLMFFDFIYMLGDFLSALSELHVKIQLVDRYCNKVMHNLRLLERRNAREEEIRDFLQTENRGLLKGLERQNIFYDKYRLKLLRIYHEGTQGELLVEDTYGGSQYIVPVKRVVTELLNHVFDSLLVQEMGLFPREGEVTRLTSSYDEKPGETARKTLLELNEAARNLHLCIKKEKLAGVEYLAAGHPVTDAQLIARAERQETDKDRFLGDPLVRKFFQIAEVKAQ
jgi:hypothetical protein